MPNFREQIASVSKVRQVRHDCEEKLYQTRLLIQRAQNRMRRANQQNTLPNPENQQAIERLKIRMARLQALLSEMNRELVALEAIFQKIRDAEQLIQFLQNKLKSLQNQIAITREKLADAENQQNFEEIEKLKLLLNDLNKQVKETQAQLDTAQHDRERLQQADNQAREKKKDIEIRQSGLREELNGLDKQIRELSNPIFEDKAAVEKEVNTLKEHEKQLVTELNRCNEALFGQIGQLYEDPHPRKVVKNIEDTTPFLLFPVKIETRFVTGNDGRPQLWLRVYPDEIAIHTHEKVLTDGEVNNGKLYWTELLVAEYSGLEKEDRRKAAWTHLANLYKGQRAAWVAQEMKPTDWNDLTMLAGITNVFDLITNKDAAFFTNLSDTITDPSVKTAFVNAVISKNSTEFFRIAEKYKFTEGVNKVAVQWISTFPVHDLTKTDAWSRAPRTNVMPDKFVITLYRGGNTREVIGNAIPDTLYVGPNPATAFDEITKTDDKIVFAESFDWVSDFPRAVQLGVGFKIALSPDEAAGGFDKIVALGLYLSADERESAAVLDDLVANHHYSPKGFSLVTQGTPTNNTERNGSGYTDNDDFNDISYFIETGEPLFKAGDDTDGRRLADALHIRYETLQYIRNTNKNDYGEALAMTTALYPATLGYYFDTLLSPIVSEKDSQLLRNYVTHYVTGRGALPAIRVGNQPYGIIITSDFKAWKPTAQEELTINQDLLFHRINGNFLARLVERLKFFEARFNEQLPKVSYIGKPTTAQMTNAKILMDVLGLQASSVEFYQRIGYAQNYISSILDFFKGGKFTNDLANLNNNAILINGFLRDHLGYVRKDSDTKAQILQILYQHFHLSLNAGNLIDNQVLSEDPTKSKAKDYIQWLKNTKDVKVLEKQDFSPATTPTPTSLLYMLLRNALLLNIYHGSYNWLVTRYNFDKKPVANAPFKNAMSAIRVEAKPTVWEFMHTSIGKIDPQSNLSNFTVGNYLLTQGIEERESTFLIEMKNALGVLENMSTAALERCLTEHLDIASYRLDAWQTGLFNMRLQTQRNPFIDEGGQGTNIGTMLGAYGYVENIRPAKNIRIPADTLPVKLRPETGDVFEYEAGKSGGFVHAPSINHASAAAVLRAGYLSHANTTNPDLLAVNLSSERVRRAMFLLDGLRNGQMLEALLGYQFERALHDRFISIEGDLNRYILDFRVAFPIEHKEIPQEGTGAATESLPPYNVVNGLKLIEADVNTVVLTDTTPATPSTVFQQARVIFNQEKDRLKDTLDAVKDLLMAENFYQLILGNFDRVAAVNLAQKDAHYPPELQVVETPRSAQLTFTNRVTLHFDDVPANFNPWSAQGISLSPRSRTEAGLNKWLSQIIGDPTQFKCQIGIVKKLKDVDGNDIETFENEQIIGLNELNLQAIDLVYLVGNELDTVGATELEARIAQVYRLTYVLDDSEIVRIFFNKPDDGSRKIAQLLPLLRRLRALIAESRPLNAGDFTPSSRQDVLTDVTNPKGYDVVDLKSRIETVHVELKNWMDTLAAIPVSLQIDAVISSTTLKSMILKFQTDKISLNTAPKESLREGVSATIALSDFYAVKNLLSNIALFGFTQAFPNVTTGSSDADKTDILKQAQVVLIQLTTTLTHYDTLLLTIKPELTIESQVDILLKLAKTVLGDIFNILPKFNYQNFADIAAADSDRNQLLDFSKTQTTLDGETLVEEWLEGTARIRTKLHKWEVIRTLVDALNDTPFPSGLLWSSMAPVQIPYRAKDSWLALEFPDKDPQDATLPFQVIRDTLSIVAHGASAFTTPTHQSGILLDDWTEQIPTAEETTGVAFHYNQPNAMPPQALLLCVAPEMTGSWSWDALMNTINDTFARAKRRAVEPDHLEQSQYWVNMLPALVSEFTTTGTNITLDLAVMSMYKPLLEVYKLKT